MPVHREDHHVRTWLAAVVAGLALLVALAALAGLAGCDRPPPPESLIEWTPGDHHSSDDKVAAGAQASALGQTPAGDVAPLVEIAWRQQCTSCHGATGRGDGPMGPMVQAPDLTRADWQAKVTDAELEATIKNGKNRMPKFELPDPVLHGLAAHIRTLGGR